MLQTQKSKVFVDYSKVCHQFKYHMGMTVNEFQWGKKHFLNMDMFNKICSLMKIIACLLTLATGVDLNQKENTFPPTLNENTLIRFLRVKNVSQNQKSSIAHPNKYFF